MLLAVATPMHMIEPISEGTLKVVWVTNSIHTIPANAPGSAIRMMNGSSHDWKLTAMIRYTSMMAKMIPRPSRKKELSMVATWPRISMLLPRASFGSVFRMIFSTADPTAPRSRRSMLAIHVVYRLHVVMVDNPAALCRAGCAPGCPAPAALGWLCPDSHRPRTTGWAPPRGWNSWCWKRLPASSRCCCSPRRTARRRACASGRTSSPSDTAASAR